MSADRFEARVADWLEDGPEYAPEDAVEVVLTHAAAHPRSRRRAVVLRVRRFAPALAAAAVLVALVGTGVAVLPRFLPAVTSTAPVAVSGTESCQNKVAGAVLSPQAGSAEADELRARIDVCEQTATDGRVSGSLTRQVDGWLFNGDETNPKGTSTDFGTISLHNDRGAWNGAMVATYRTRMGVVDGRMTWIALGSGEYTGLVYRATVVTDAQGKTSLTGTIAPIAKDAAIATTWCWVDTADPDLSAGESVPHRVMERSCTVASDDERLAGSAVEHRTLDVRADGSTVDIGTLDTTTAVGGWSGTFSGTGSWYIPGEVSGVLEGSGALRGQRLSIRLVSEDGMHGVLVGTISSAR